MTESEYAPEPSVEWVLSWTPNEPIDSGAALEVSKALHAAGVRHTLYGREVASGRWTFAVARDVRGPFDQLAAASLLVDYAAPNAEDEVAKTLEAVEQVVGYAITPSLPVAEAATRAQILAELQETLDQEVAVLLRQPRFDRRAVHEALGALGLQPTDGPMYEPDGEPDRFVVEVHPDRLFLYLHPARSTEPERCFEALVVVLQRLEQAFPDAARDLRDAESLDALRARIAETTQTLRAAGFQPGAHPTLMLF